VPEHRIDRRTERAQPVAEEVRLVRQVVRNRVDVGSETVFHDLGAPPSHALAVEPGEDPDAECIKSRAQLRSDFGALNDIRDVGFPARVQPPARLDDPAPIEMLFDQPVPRQGVRRFGARKVSIERIAVLSLEVRDDDVGVSDLRAVAVDDVGKLAVGGASSSIRARSCVLCSNSSPVNVM
jgi:hypothetical protein